MNSAPSDLLAALQTLNVWQRGGERAPHKPLLLILALAEWSRGNFELNYAKCEPKLRDLLTEFGRPSRSVHPEYPFWRLQNDGLWTVEADRTLKSRESNSDIPRTELRSSNARGHFSPEVLASLQSNPSLANDAVTALLNAHFPESLHEDLLNAVEFVTQTTGRQSAGPTRRRDPNFRNEVLTAYGYRCAVCGLDLRVGNLTIGIEAAHIKWHQAAGPSSVTNGIALCSLHHKLFDFGAFTLSTDDAYAILVSEQVNGSEGVESTLLRHHGQSLNLPLRPEQVPNHAYTRWHQSEVFRGSARPYDGSTSTN